MTYPQQPDGEQAFDPAYGDGPPPPRKKNTAAIVSRVAVLALVLTGLGIAGFVAPGFFLSEEGDTPVGGSPSTTSTTSTTSAAAEAEDGLAIPAAATTVMNGFLAAVNNGQASAAKAALCTDAGVTAADVDQLIDADANLAIDPSMSGGTTATDESVHSVQLDLMGTVKDQELDEGDQNLWVYNPDGTWCVHNFHVVVP